MPAPPPPPPPPAAAPSAAPNALLLSIQKGAALKKTITNDRSSPAIEVPKPANAPPKRFTPTTQTTPHRPSFTPPPAPPPAAPSFRPNSSTPTINAKSLGNVAAPPPPPPPPPPPATVPGNAPLPPLPRASNAVPAPASKSLTALNATPTKRDSKTAKDLSSVQVRSEDTMNSKNSLGVKEAKLHGSESTRVSDTSSQLTPSPGLAPKELSRLEAKRMKEEEKDWKRVRAGTSSGTLGVSLDTSATGLDGAREQRMIAKSKRRTLCCVFLVGLPSLIVLIGVVLLCLFYFYWNATVSFDVKLSSGGAVDSSDAQTFSLKYFVRSVQICEHVDTSNFGTSGAGKCLSLYSNPLANLSVNSYTISNALLEPDTGSAITAVPPQNVVQEKQTAWTNFVSKASVSTLSSTQKVVVPFQNVEYKYVIVSWYRPVKITAKLDLLSSETDSGVGYVLATRGTSQADGTPNANDFQTSPAGGVFDVTSNRLISYQAKNGSFLAAGSLINDKFSSPYFEQSIVPCPVTDSWHALQEPLTVAFSDGFQKQNKRISLILDDASVLIQGLARNIRGKNLDTSSLLDTGNLVDTSGNSIYVPPISFLPVSGSSSSIVTIERYLISLDSQNLTLQLSIAAVAQPSSPPSVASASIGVIPGLNFKASTGLRSKILVVPRVAKMTMPSPFSFVTAREEIIFSAFDRLLLVGQEGYLLVNCDTFMGWEGSCANFNETGYERVRYKLFIANALGNP
ncbi:hypothetical protein CcCBS67573_g07155 [Chytriomyces confervae]|uniref:WH2 domain-containing protein n=1 Tax=Chytriomyces confervae TaxID=246404 RepID=A0A507EWQ0_9FUNG|nr:hypothetical protein CcCBS67573_g07155 [Chytriomyces confervae]